MAEATGRSKCFAVSTRVVDLDPLTSRMLRTLTRKFLKAKVRLVRDCVNGVVRLGSILEQGRACLQGKGYHRWVRKLGISVGTAAHWVALCRLARRSPTLIRRWRKLGATKLYWISRISSAERRRLMKEKSRRDLVKMNKFRFIALTAPHVRIIQEPHPARRAHGLHMKLRAWNRTLMKVVLRDLDDSVLRRSLIEDLHDLLRLARRLSISLRRRQTA